MVIDNTGGLLVGLEEFATYEGVKSHLSCFKDYFGYDGSGYYNGTIFRFPLRTGEYQTSLPKNVYDSNRVLENLFGPFKQEVENCLLFMKSLNAIKVSVKEATGIIRRLYSAEINPIHYRDSLSQHRQEMFEFIEAEKYLGTTSCHISIFPVSLIESDLSKTISLWLVINILGLIDNISTREFSVSYSNLSDTYLPWVSVAIPLPLSQLTFQSITKQHCWSMEFETIARLFELIDIHLPTIPLSSEVTDFVGSLFCFLPVATSSKFPFHVQGYFALSTNRRSIKWPRYDDTSLDAAWNKQLVESLGTISYAVLIHICVSRLQCEGSSALVYKLLSCLPPGSEQDQLQAVMHRGMLELMQDRALVCTKSECKWVSLQAAHFLPSPFVTYSIPCEKLCSEFLTALSYAVVEVPSGVARVLLEYSFLRDRVVPQILTPRLVRQLLVSFKEESCLTDFLFNKSNVYSLLEVVLSDIYSYPTAPVLNGIQLVPICNSELPEIFDNKSKYMFYIYEQGLELIKLFPGLESIFIESSLPPGVHASLLKLSRKLKIYITDITNISTDAQLFYNFLKCSMQRYFNTESIVKWTPGVNGQPSTTWIESVWKFISNNTRIIEIILQKKLPILPKQNVSLSQEVDLLPLIAPPTPYIKISNRAAHSKIEKLLAASGCHLCCKNTFISEFHQFVNQSLPKGFFPILRLTNIKNNFLKKLSKADDPTRQSLIKIIIQNAELVVQSDLDLLMSFPIFISVSNTWVSISQFTQCFIPHSSMPQDLVHFPDNYLSPFENDNIVLCHPLNIKPLSLDATIQQHLLPLISKGYFNRVPRELEKLTLWILRSVDCLNRDTIRSLSTAKWLCSSTNKTAIKTLYSPPSLFDPNDKHLTKLLGANTPGMFPNSIYKNFYQVLINLGLRTCKNITYDDLRTVVAASLRTVPFKERQDWLNSLLSLISMNMDRLSLSKQSFWNTLKQQSLLIPSSRSRCTAYPNYLPFFKHSSDLCKPQEIILCSEKDACLIAGVAPLLIENANRMEKYRAIYQCMGVNVTIPLQLVCKQLTLIITKETANLASGDVLTLVEKIYKYFGKLIVANSDSILRNVILPENCIFIPDFGFTNSQRLILTCHEILFPYMVSLDKYYAISDNYLFAFFKFLNIDPHLTSAKCQSILRQLQGTTLSEEQVGLSLRLILFSHQCIVGEKTAGEYLILAQNNNIYPARECMFNDLPWLRRTEISTTKPIVNAHISNKLASDFGCTPASTALAPSAEGVSYSFATGCGQSEDLVARLTGILEGYRMQLDVFKELIQNADDAGARTVKFLFDYTTHPSTSVLDEAIKDIHGPALYFFNDAVFTERDFESILKLSSGNKVSSANKIGRFGVGFNAVYNLTDCPSFVSDCLVQIFDPLKKYIGPYNESSGVRFRYTEDKSALNTYHDQFNVYNDLFGCNLLQLVPYKHTLFRLPFRRTPSIISSQTFGLEEISKLQYTIQEKLTQMILFLQNVTSIEMFVRMEPTSIERVLSVNKSDCKTTHFISNNQKYFQLSPSVNWPTHIISSTDTLSITSESTTEHSVQKFLISYASGVGKCHEVLWKFKNRSPNVGLLPLCGVAIPLQYIDNIPNDPNCSLYTFLPLPITSPLPLHINGYFSLSDSRKNISDAKTHTYLDLPTEWNLALINDALPNALISAVAALPSLQPLSGTPQMQSLYNYYSLWTVANRTDLLWKEFSNNLASRIVQSFNSTHIFSCAQDPTKWVAFNDISFLSLEDTLTHNAPFIESIYTLCLAIRIKFANVPNEFFSTKVFKAFAILAPNKVYRLKRIIEDVISLYISILPLERIIIIFKTLIPLCINENNNWLVSWLCKTKCIPCGVSPNNFQLRTPSMVVSLNTNISALYQAREQRHPVGDLHDMFSLNTSDHTSIVLKRLGVIHEKLPQCEIIGRCQITEKLENVELATQHAFILINYLSNEDKSVLSSVYDTIRSIRFIPVYKDEIVSILSDKLPTLAAPQECYSYNFHNLVTPVLMCASREVRNPEVLRLLSDPPLEAVILVLDKLIEKADIFREEINIQGKVLEIYKYLCQLQTSWLKEINVKLNTKTWIWHPEFREFYAANQVIISPDLLKFGDNKYLISFPYRDALGDKNFETFLKNVGLEFGISDDNIMVCFERIYADFGTKPLDPKLVEFVLFLINSIKSFERFSNTRCIISQYNILYRPKELYINFCSHLDSYFSEKHYRLIVNSSIHPTKAYRLGARPSEEMFCTNSNSEFGLQEGITDRIMGLIREIPLSSVVKEMIQNAEDAKATEIVFILDDQDYSSKTETLINSMCPRWKDLHSFPSLTVYNNKAFSEDDIKGIQTLSVGGKSNNPNTIGKFGLGFNSVYHVTNAPTFITSCTGKKGLTFCCFDPFLNYTENQYGNQKQKRGTRSDIPCDNFEKFADQLYPFRYKDFKSNSDLSESFVNLWQDHDFTMFRFPLDINEADRRHCSIDELGKALMDVLRECPDILLFLSHLCKLKVLSIDRDKNVTLHFSLSVTSKNLIQIEKPSWFPLRESAYIQEKETISKYHQKNWLIYSQSVIAIEEYVASNENLEKYKDYCLNEKLSGYGAIAIQTSPLNSQNLCTLFTHLPVGLKTQFPVHINAPLILDSSRQNLHSRKIPWEDAWHSSVIKHILVPLYAMLLLDLGHNNTQLKERDYFYWFYSLFPNSSKIANAFLSELSNELFVFLSSINAPLLLADNLDVLDKRIWYTLYGDKRGIFKPSLFFDSHHICEIKKDDKREDEIRKSLILINIPLTFAPLTLLTYFKNLTQLSPTVLLSLLNDTPKCLVKEQSTSCDIESLVLNFQQMQTILQYVLTEKNSVLASCKIPLRIDLSNNLGDFDTNDPSYLSDYSSLLPHCARNFVSLHYTHSVIYKLLSLDFVKNLDPDFLAKHLNVESFQCSTNYYLFWEFVMANKLSQGDLSKFDKHLLVPVIFESIHCNENMYYSIGQLKFIITSLLQDNHKVLFDLLNKLGCPRLNFNSLTNQTRYTMNPEDFVKELNAFVNTIAISDIRASDIILGSIQCCTNLTSATLNPDESTELLNICSKLTPSTLSNDQLSTLSSLKMFEDLSSRLLSLEQCQVCYVEEYGIPLCSTLLNMLYKKYKLIIFKNIHGKFLQALCQALNKRLINISVLFSDYIFVNLPTFPVADKKIIICFLAGRLVENKHDLISHLIDLLTNIPFILASDQQYRRVNQLYSSDIQFISEFLPHSALPGDWSDSNLNHLFVTLGLHECVSLDNILLVATEFSMQRFECGKLQILLNQLVINFNDINWEKLTPSEVDILSKLGNIKFLPVWKKTDITHTKEHNQTKLAKFSDAQLYEHRHCCCTTAWIHKLSFKFHPLSFQKLQIHKDPNPKLVVVHLKTIISQLLLQYCQTNIPIYYAKYFYSCYSYFERSKPLSISLEEFNELRCILWEQQLYYPVNMLFTTTEELKPFTIQLPSEIASKYPTFLKCIGVEETANHTHFSYVLTEIHNKLAEKKQKLVDSDYEKQSKIVFSSLIRNLRKLESAGNSPDLNLAKFLLLTRDSQLLPSMVVVYADNQSLLSRVTMAKIDVHTLIPLEPDDNKSCVPPSCLKLKKLSSIIKEEIDPQVFMSKQIRTTSFTKFLEGRLKEPLVYHAMRRLYFHLTKNDLDHLVFYNGQSLLVSNGHPPPNFLTVLRLLEKLEVESVEQIDLNLIDERNSKKYVLQNASSCYIIDNKFLLSDHHTKHEFLLKDVVYNLNSYFGDIFTEVIYCLEVCIQIQDPSEIMAKLDEYNILRDDTCPMPTEIRDFVASRNRYSGYHPTSHASMQPPRPEGISLGEPDPSAAHLSLIVSQNELLAAQHLITPIHPKNDIFPPLACFLCFEALINTFQSFLHFKGSVERLTEQRNLRVFLKFISHLLTNTEIYRKIEVLTCTLMNYDVDTRYPPASLIPFLGCYLPQQLYTVDQAREAIDNVKEITVLLTRIMYPDSTGIILFEQDPMLTCGTASIPLLTESILHCKL